MSSLLLKDKNAQKKKLLMDIKSTQTNVAVFPPRSLSSPQHLCPYPFLHSVVDNPVSVHSPSLVKRSLSILIVSNKNSHTYALSLSLSLCRTHTGGSFISMKTDNKSFSYHTRPLSLSFFFCSFFHISFRLSGGRLDTENTPLLHFSHFPLYLSPLFLWINDSLQLNCEGLKVIVHS